MFKDEVNVWIKYCYEMNQNVKYIVCFVIGWWLVSCAETRKEQVGHLVREWKGREIVYPNNMLYSILGKDTSYIPKSEYTIVNYIDSGGCTSCKLQLTEWKRLIAQLDSVGNTSVLFFLYPKSRKEMIYILKRDNFTHPVCLDTEDSFNKLNKFPQDEMFHTFLLDRDNKVLAIGNPIHNPKVKELYLKIISGDKSTKEEAASQTTVACSNMVIDMGKFDWRQSQSATFTLTNAGNNPLVITDAITSCGCTTVDYEKEPVRPGNSIALTVHYKAEHSEHFDKMITVYCNTKIAPIRLKITGNAE